MNDLPVMDFKPPLHISHRGGAAIGPENTMPTLRRAVDEFQTDVLELDVQQTADGVLVIHHDPTLDRTTSGAGLLKEFTFDELRRFDAGYHFSPDGGGSYPFRDQGYQVPTLEEVFETFPTVLFHIDIKQNDPPIEDAVIEMIRTRRLVSRVFLGSICEKISKRICRKSLDIATYPARRGLWKLFILHNLHLLWLDRSSNALVSIVPRMKSGRPVITPRFVRDIHRRGRKIFAFVVDDPLEQRQLLDYGVDGIMTDRPDVLRNTLDEWGNN